MRDLAAVRRRFVILAVVLALVAVAAGAFLLTPYGRSRQRLQADFERLRLERQRKDVENGPLENIDQKLVLARKQIDDFYRDRLPSQYSEVSAELSKQASAGGVKLGGVKYELDKDVPAPGVRAIHISVAVVGNYVNVMKFINALERDKMLFVPASVDLTEGQGGVSLDLKLDTYLREPAAGTAGGI